MIIKFPYVDKGLSLQALNQFKELHNTQNLSLSKQFRTRHMILGHVLIEFFWGKLYKRYTIQRPGVTAIIEQSPLILKTNRRQISDRTGQGFSTISRVISQLIEMKVEGCSIIHSKLLNGPNQNFSLYLNPEIFIVRDYDSSNRDYTPKSRFLPRIKLIDNQLVEVHTSQIET